jgi:hypothetical protein
MICYIQSKLVTHQRAWKREGAAGGSWARIVLSLSLSLSLSLAPSLSLSLSRSLFLNLYLPLPSTERLSVTCARHESIFPNNFSK